MSSKYMVSQLISCFSNIQQTQPLASPTIRCLHCSSVSGPMILKMLPDIALLSVISPCCRIAAHEWGAVVQPLLNLFYLYRAFVYVLYMAGTTHDRCCTNSMYTHIHHFPSGYCSLILILDSHLTVFTMGNSVPLKSPHSVSYLEVGVAWVVFSWVFHKHTSIPPLLSPFGWILVKHSSHAGFWKPCWRRSLGRRSGKARDL